MSNKFGKKQAPLPGFNKKEAGERLTDHVATRDPISRSARNDVSPNSEFRTQNSELPRSPNSEFKTQNSKFPEPPHPLAPPSFPRIDILHGGHQSHATRDMLTLVRQSLREMEAG